mmetsp:Transcript_13535/g.16124  ORF Transcript_13535/g.16124 Transcript_13535/m.16124 type:complete len:99 (+) Transcript_13535:695-991(+)
MMADERSWDGVDGKSEQETFESESQSSKDFSQQVPFENDGLFTVLGEAVLDETFLLRTSLFVVGINDRPNMIDLISSTRDPVIDSTGRIITLSLTFDT